MPQIYNRLDESPALSANSGLSPPHPQLHRRRRRSSSSSSSTSSSSLSSSMSMTPRPTLMDADDSIVLSDLVRTGEASRLRRRGAMRLDRNVFQATQNPYLTRRTLAMDTDDSESDDELLTYAYASADGVSTFNGSSERRHRPYPSRQHPYSRWSTHENGDRESEEDHDISYTLVCGAETDDPCMAYEPDAFDSTPFKPSLLPIPPPSESRYKPLRRKRISNGCGTVIHITASASTCSTSNTPVRTYVARTPATDAVVTLAPEYFQSRFGVKFESSPCGCVKEGIGCAVCGNPLGTRWKFCKMMAEGRRKPSIRGLERQSRPLRPEGPRYWQGMASSSNSRSRLRASGELEPLQSSSPLSSNSVPPCPSSSSGPISSSTSSMTPPQSFTKQESQLQIELYTFFADAVTAYRDSWSPLPKSTYQFTLPPTHPNSPVLSPVVPSSAESPVRRLIWDSEDPFFTQGGLSNPVDNEEQSNLVTALPEGQELDIELGMQHLVPAIETMARQSRSMSLPNSLHPPSTQSISQRSSVAIFARQLTASPEPLQFSVSNTPENPPSEIQTRRAPAFTFETLRGPSRDSWTSSAQGGSGMVSRLQSQVGGYPDDGARTPTTRSIGALSEPQIASLEQSLEEQRITHPQPRSMSFYQQQILGAWERERERERQRDWMIDMRPARSRGRSPVGRDLAAWDILPRVNGASVSEGDETENTFEDGEGVEANTYSSGSMRMFFDR